MLLDLDLDIDGEAETEPAPVEDGTIAADIALLLQPLDPAQAGRRRQADPVGQFNIAEPAARLQGGKDSPAEFVLPGISYDRLQFWPEKACYCRNLAVQAINAKDHAGPGHAPCRHHRHRAADRKTTALNSK